MRNLFHTTLAALSLGFALITPALAQDHSAHAGHGAAAGTSATAPAAQADALTAGEITRVDKRTGKLTIRHEEIKNLEMPPMTMVFALADASQSNDFKAGDKVQFRAEKVNGAYRVFDLTPQR